MPSGKHKHRSTYDDGFTVIELIVVFAVIGVAIALIAPGLLVGAQTARRIQCANNMRQLALGLNQYHEIHGSLPPAWICDRRDQRGPQWGWIALILPMVEEARLYQTIQPGPNSIADVFSQGPTGEQAFSESVYSTTCPSDRSESLGTERSFDQGNGVPRGWQAPATNYVANVGFFSRSANYENHGVMYGNSAIPMKAIEDGTSSTFLFGERDALGGGATWIGIADPQDSGANGFAWVGGVVSVPMNCPTIEGCRDQGFSSQHPGGSQFAFCDGSVHFISHTIDFSNGSANRFDSTSDTLLTDAEKAQLGVYQQLGVRDDARPIIRLP